MRWPHPPARRAAAVGLGLILLLVPVDPVGAAADVVANGTFTGDAAGWSFVATAGAPTGSWDAAGQANGGAVEIASSTGSRTSEAGRWQEALPEIVGGSTVTLSYAWKKSYEAKAPQQQDIAVEVLTPGGARVALDTKTGAPAAYDTWYVVADKDVSAHFAATGVYTLELRFTLKTGRNAQAQAIASFDEVRLLVTPPGDQWIEEAQTTKVGTYGQALAGDGTYLYVVRNSAANADPEMWRYDPGADLWSTLSTADLPTGAFRNGATLTWDGASYLYALGGARYSDADRRAFYRYDIAADAWTTRADAPSAEGAGDAAAWSDADGVLYALLGSKDHGAAFAKYDAAGDAWTTLAAPPARTDDGASLAWAGGPKLYAMRGEADEANPLQDFWEYDAANDTWSSLTDIPEVDGVGDGGSLVWIGGHDAARTDYLYALGGGDPAENAGADVYRYAVSAGSWETLPDVPYPVGNFNGNRLGYAGGFLHYWQGSPGTFDGGGKRTARLEFAG